jgi:hypothetical protein
MKPALRIYRFKVVPERHIKLIKLFDANVNQKTEEKFFNGWASTPWGWLIDPLPFRQHFRSACVFSRKEFHPQYPNLVKVWLYTSHAKAFFKNEEDRESFQCWVNPDCLYLVDMS